MIKSILASLLVVVLGACAEKEENAGLPTEVNADGVKAIPLKYQGNFRLRNLKTFKFTYHDIDSLDLVQIDSADLTELLQQDDLLKYNQSDYAHYYYSLQTGNGNYNSITIVMNRDFDFVVFCLVYSYDGKLISRFEVAGEGGDGRFRFQSSGTFTNDSTYFLKRMNTEVSEVDSTILKKEERRIFRLTRKGTLRFP